MGESAPSQQSNNSSFFANVTSTWSAITASVQKQTEQGFPDTMKRLNDFSQNVQQRARDLPKSLANLPGTFEAEREQFLRAQAAQGIRHRSELVAPWEGYGPYEREMKRRLLEVSKDQRNFLFSPPDDTDFQFDLKAYEQSAKAALLQDPELDKMRFLLVPQQVQETTFWRNYFYRVTLTKQAVLSEPVPAEPEPADHEEQPAVEKKDEVLFDFGDSDEEGEAKHTKEKQLEENPDASKGTEEPTKPRKEPAAKIEKKKEEAQPETSPGKTKSAPAVDPKEFEGMEDWEVELRKAATEDM
ncbi:hypothetical protein BCR43DRAFT_493600 [Syncephalastrum racemosum]|uniref:BSD domain-containing protein n=1 Tax=Syncephalastrum racemosum TaxID=13706 RepID=A0A1X2HAT9_SYNRA|nr:hypothetical protein BCR43DRAFT_493600 [Syncephalastrum racemosum]